MQYFEKNWGKKVLIQKYMKIKSIPTQKKIYLIQKIFPKIFPIHGKIFQCTKLLIFLDIYTKFRFYFCFFSILEIKRFFLDIKYFSLKIKKKNSCSQNFFGEKKDKNIWIRKKLTLIFREMSMKFFKFGLKKRFILLKRSTIFFKEKNGKKKKKSSANSLFREQKISKKKIDTNNIRSSQEGKTFFDMEKKKTGKFSVQTLYKYSGCEFNQIRGSLDCRGKRIKDYTSVWDETIWMSKILNLGRKGKRENFFEEVFILLIFIQTNNSDFCTVCLSQKKFLEGIFHKFQDGSFFWHLFFLDKSWNQNFSKRRKTKKKAEHFCYCIDQAFNYNIFLEKINSNMIFLEDRSSFFYVEIFVYIWQTKINLRSDDFLFLGFCENLYDKKKKNPKIKTSSLTNCLLKVFFYSEEKKNKKKIKTITWPLKTYDTIIRKVIQKFTKNFFLLQRKIQINVPLQLILLILFDKIAQIDTEEENKFILEKKDKEYFSNFFIWHINKQFFKENMNKKFRTSLLSFFSFSKKKYFLESKIIFKKIFQPCFFQDNFFIVTSVYFFLPCFFFKKFQKLLFLENKKTFFMKVISRTNNFFNRFEINPFFSENEKKIRRDYCICIIKMFERKELGYQKQPILSFSIGTSNLQKKGICYFEIKFCSKNFCSKIFFICAKYRVNTIFIQTESSFQSSFLLTLKKFIMKKNNELKKRKDYKSSSAQKKIFFEKIQVLSFPFISWVLDLLEMFSQFTYFDKKTSLINLTLILLKNPNRNFLCFLTSRKFSYYPLLFSEFLFLTKKEIYQIFVFCQRQIVSEFFYELDYFFQSKKGKVVSKFNCGLGDRTVRFLTEKNIPFFQMYKDFSLEQITEKKKLKSNELKKNLFFKNFKKLKEYDNNHQKKNPKLSELFFMFAIFLQHLTNLKDNQLIFEESIQRIKECSNSKLEVLNNNSKNVNSRNFALTIKNFFNLDLKFDVHFRIYLNEIMSCNDIETHFKFIQKILKASKKQKKKIYTKGCRNFLIEKNGINDLLEIRFIERRGLKSFVGVLRTGFGFFIEKRDMFTYPLYFRDIVIKNLSISQAKIIAIYPKIFKARMRIVPRKNISFFFSKNKRLNIDKKTGIEKKLKLSKFRFNIPFYKNFNKDNSFILYDWITKQKPGQYFIWNIKKSSFLLSFIVDPNKFFFFSLTIFIGYDIKSGKSVFVRNNEIFLNLNELFKKFFLPFKNFFVQAITHDEFYKKSQLQLQQKILKGKNIKKKDLAFYFCLSDKSGHFGNYFLFIYGKGGHYYKDFFFIDRRGFNLRQSTFSTVNSLKKLIFKNLNKYQQI